MTLPLTKIFSLLPILEIPNITSLPLLDMDYTTENDSRYSGVSLQAKPTSATCLPGLASLSGSQRTISQ
jgi:hypothetical protein